MSTLYIIGILVLLMAQAALIRNLVLQRRQLKHDLTAQNLFAITVNLQNLRQTERGLTPRGHEVFDECLAQCEQSLREVRTLSYVLHPPVWIIWG